jgi:hypothetical protein
MELSSDVWKKCSTCKKPIGFEKLYYICSVSTCQGDRTGYSFCSVNCFESHLPGARHRSAGAVEMNSPKRIIVSSTTPNANATPIKPSSVTKSNEVLVIASRLKEYISETSGMNTSASVMDVLSNHLRVVCERGLENARADGRKTLMDRDFDFLKGR